MLDDLLARFRQGDRRALARLLSLVARGEAIPEILAALPSAETPARVVAITGSAGVGKSTLVGKLLDTIRGQGPSVAVLACDPQSPLSGGALLGDRFRMPTRADDAGVFIRSLAAAADQGTVAGNLRPMLRLLEAFGFNVIIVETVGAGQGDTAIRNLVDVVVLLLQPATGDDLQWEKAGVLEVADVIVIHKADLPDADRVESQVKMALGLTAAETVPVVRVSAKTGQGIEELWQTIAARPSRLARGGDGRALLEQVQDELATRWTQGLGDDQALRELLAAWQAGQIDRRQVVDQALKLLANRD